MLESFFANLETTNYRVFTLHVSIDGAVEEVDSNRFLLEIRRWAIRFQTHPEQVIAIFGRMTFSMTAAWFGALMAGKWPVFLSHPSRKIQADDYQRKLTNYTERFQGCLFVGEQQERQICPELLSPTDPAHDFIPSSIPLPPFSPDKPIFLQCSSGTTGLQKAVAMTPRMLTTQIETYSKTLNLNPAQDHIISWLPLYHDMGLVGVFLLALLTKTPLTLLETFEWAANPSWLLKVMAHQHGTLCWLPNFAFSLLARTGGSYDLSRVRSFINCSEPVSVSAFNRFVSTFKIPTAQLSICYALAEHVFAVSQTPLGRPPKALLIDRMALARRRLRVLGELTAGEPINTNEQNHMTAIFSCGPVLPGVSIQTATRNPEEEIGEILLQGTCAVSGYHGHPPLREDGWLPTGDLGFLYNGELFVTGRTKDVIIHNGKNIHPQDVEEVVHRHPEVHAGRVSVMGRLDETVDSEQVQVLFEPVRYLSPQEQFTVCQTLRQELDAQFDMRCEVACLPRNWLLKTSSGKMARLENSRRYLTASQTEVHLIGDSHVRIFWSTPSSHHNRYQRIHAHWLGLLWSENWKQSLPFFAKLIPRLQTTDIIIVQCGEPECRSIFPVAPDPRERIRQSVEAYREFFQTLRKIWPGRLAYMTGIPTHPQNIDNGDPLWPILGSPEARYRWQKEFYQAMSVICTECMIHFIDVCTPALGANGYLDTALLCDKAHLDPTHEGVLLERLGIHFGYLDLTPNTPPPETQVWDGTYEQFEALMRQKIKTIHPLIEASDWEHLVSGGVLDSLSIVELVAMLEQTFHFHLPPNLLRRKDFESIPTIWECFGPHSKR
ncbi:MAG: AMP-binding protein [Magnetococcus sp. YQC-5]